MIKKIHILLSIGNLNKYQMPSKVIEYLSLGKPVLHFAEIKDDPLYNFEELFDNLMIINNKTTKNELEVYFTNIKEKGPTINLDNLINVYPNPTRNNFIIESDLVITSITIYNMLFDKVFETNNFNKFISINLSDYKSSLFFIEIEIENKLIRKKIIKSQ